MTSSVGRSPKILLVDDDTGVLAGIKAYFEMVGIEVVTTSSVFEVHFLIGREMPDLVLLDVGMPVLGGVRIMESLGERTRRSTHFILFSGMSRRELAALTEQLGATDCINKVEDMPSIERKVRFWIDAARRKTA